MLNDKSTVRCVALGVEILAPTYKTLNLDQNHYEEVLAPGPLGPPQTTSLIQQHLKQQPPNITTKSWGAANVHQQSQLTRDPETSTMAALLDHSTFVPSLREDRKKKHSVNHNLVMILSN